MKILTLSVMQDSSCHHDFRFSVAQLLFSLHLISYKWVSSCVNGSKSGISPLSALRSRTNYLSDVCSYTVFSMGWLSHTHRNISKILGSFILLHVEHGKTHPIYGQFSISKRHCEDNNQESNTDLLGTLIYENAIVTVKNNKNDKKTCGKPGFI